VAEPSLPVDIHGTVRVETDGQSFDVIAQGGQVVIDLPSAGVLKSLVRGPGERSHFNAVTSLLQRHDVEVVIQLKGQTIATLGRSAEPGAVEKAFRLHGVDVKFRDLAKALFKR